MMIHYRAAFLLSILLTLGLLPLSETFSLAIPKTGAGFKRVAALRRKEVSPSENVRVATRLRSTTEAIGRDATEAGPRKKDKLTTEAQELLDAFASREREACRYDLLVAQVAPSVR
jgi:hypothetical protein